MAIAKPKCSACGVEGLTKVAIQPAPANKNILVASCGDCGNIHSVFAKPFEPPQVPRANQVEIIQ